MAYTINVNGVDHAVDVDGDTPLLWVLRDVLGMTGTKFGCGIGAMRRLHGPFGRRRRPAPASPPIDSVGTSRDHHHRGHRRTRQRARRSSRPGSISRSSQCGYCQSGQIMSAAALLASNPHPSDADIDDAMAGNICRCGTYVRIRAAIKRAAQSTAAAGEGRLT